MKVTIAILVITMTGCAHNNAMTKWNHYVENECQGFGTLSEEEERELINRKKLKVGMSSCAVFKIKGPPSSINSSGGKYGNRTQYVFGGYRYSGGYKFGEKASYVYTEDGAVTSWQY